MWASDAASGPPRRARGVALVAFYAVDLALVTLAIEVYSNGWFDPLVRATGGLVNNTLILHVVSLPLLVGGAILALGRLRPGDVGLRRSDLPTALAVFVLTWVVIQVVGVVFALATTGTLELNPLWAHRGFTGVIGLLLAQVLGNALLEEVGYRGFLLPVVGVHALVNTPTLLVAAPVGSEITDALAVLLLVAWPSRAHPASLVQRSRAALASPETHSLSTN